MQTAGALALGGAAGALISIFAINLSFVLEIFKNLLIDQDSNFNTKQIESNSTKDRGANPYSS